MSEMRTFGESFLFLHDLFGGIISYTQCSE